LRSLATITVAAALLWLVAAHAANFNAEARGREEINRGYEPPATRGGIFWHLAPDTWHLDFSASPRLGDEGILASRSQAVAAHADDFPAPRGFAPILWPADNPYSAARVELGRVLFFDARLSSNNRVACAFCHAPSHAFAGATALATGVDGTLTRRRAPTLINRAWAKSEFWDGRAPTLEAQIVVPLTSPHEMGMTADGVLQKLRAIKGYAPLFAAAFGDSTITYERITKAIATFERTIVSANSPYDRYLAGDKTALTKQQRDGLDFFNKKGECAECHTGPNLTDEKFANAGVGADRKNPDAGRAEVTGNRRDWGKFKVPTLRDLAVRAPYMHDGSVKTLSEVLDIYAQGGLPNPRLDTRLAPFYLDAETKHALLAFLDALNGEGWQPIHPPAMFPQ
jgi:cytochrome c peroxidase